MKLDIGDNWTVSPTFMGQSIASSGFFGYDPAVGDLDLVHFGPENSQDSFTQSALTVEGKFADFDLVYAGAYMKRTTHSIADYSDYSEFYDRVYGSGAIWQDAKGNPIMPQELVVTKGYFQKWSHELRLSSPQELPIRGHGRLVHSASIARHLGAVRDAGIWLHQPLRESRFPDAQSGWILERSVGAGHREFHLAHRRAARGP